MWFPSPCGVWVVSELMKAYKGFDKFLSPCGVWVVSKALILLDKEKEFPSPCGVWVVSWRYYYYDTDHRGFRPLAGCGLFLYCRNDGADDTVSVPLRGVGCFRQGAASATGYQGFPSPCGVWVVSSTDTTRTQTTRVSVPLRGVGCFVRECIYRGFCPVSIPLRGVGCFKS